MTPTTSTGPHPLATESAARSSDPIRPVSGLLPLELKPFRADSDEERTRLLEQGLARRLIADVLVPIDAPDSRIVRADAVRLLLQLDTSPDLGWVVGFSSAAWLHTGFSGGPVGEPEPAPLTELQVVITPGHRRPRSPSVKGRQVALSPEEVTFMEGVRVTNPVRTAADVARDLPEAEALQALRRLGELTGVRAPQVRSLLSTMRYARGAAIARTIVKRWEEEA
jgi:hypothetical protein